jgi:hypothetical protein
MCVGYVESKLFNVCVSSVLSLCSTMQTYANGKKMSSIIFLEREKNAVKPCKHWEKKIQKKLY